MFKKFLIIAVLLGLILFATACDEQETTTTTLYSSTTTETTSNATTVTTIPLSIEWDNNWPAFESGCQVLHIDFANDSDALDFAFLSVSLAEVAPDWMPPDKRKYYQWWENYWNSEEMVSTEWEVIVGAIGGNTFYVVK